MLPYLTHPSGRAGELRRRVVERGRPDKTVSYRTRGGSQTVRSVCATCNNGWMSDLETEAQPLLEPLLKGEIIRLSEPEQMIAATWAVKTVLVLGTTVENRVVAEFYKDFYSHRTPSEGTLVALAAGIDPAFGMVDFKPMRVTDVFGPMPYPQNAYVSLICAGRLVVWVASWREIPLPLPRLSEWEDPLTPIWPVMNPVASCPEKYVLDPRGIQELAEVAFLGRDVNSREVGPLFP